MLHLCVLCIHDITNYDFTSFRNHQMHANASKTNVDFDWNENTIILYI